MASLHILNGDAPREAFEQTGIAGDVLVWRETMMTGPCRGDLDLDAFVADRAAYLAALSGRSLQEVQSDRVAMEARIDAVGPGDTVTLWFEDDLFCHVHVWYLLARLDRDASVDLICGEERIGPATPEQLRGLFDRRLQVAPEIVDWCRAAWKAYAASNPTSLVALASKPAPLAFGAKAIALHLSRFPSAANGLGHLESRLLEYAAEGVDSFAVMFERFSSTEPDWGLGGSNLYEAAERLARGPSPLVELGGASTADDTSDVTLTLTSTGRAVLAGDEDALECTRAHYWLGGVEVEAGRSTWRWDAESSPGGASGTIGQFVTN